MLAGSRISSRLIAATFVSVALVACTDSTAPSKGSDPATETYAASLGVNIAQMTKMSDALYTQDVIVGTGAAAVAGDSISVNYILWRVDGSVADSSHTRTAFPFKLGVGRVIAGWDLGLVGLKVGGKRRLVIGSDLGYGGNGAGCQQTTNPPCIIAPNSTLVFDVTMLGDFSR